MPKYISVVLLVCVVQGGAMEAQQPGQVSFGDLIQGAGHIRRPCCNSKDT
jgi:hypothetical protein